MRHADCHFGVSLTDKSAFATSDRYHTLTKRDENNIRVLSQEYAVNLSSLPHMCRCNIDAIGILQDTK